MVRPLIWRHLGERFGVAAPDLASLRAVYRRAQTLVEHQQIICDTLGLPPGVAARDAGGRAGAGTGKDQQASNRRWLTRVAIA
jgi:hypothetical protein